MKLTQLKSLAKHAVYLLDKHSPIILTGLAVASGITAVVLASKATIKATRVIDAQNAKRIEESQPKMNALDVVKTVGIDYIPAGLTLVASASCMIASTAILSKRNAALMSMCALATTQLKEHEEKIEELFGKKKAQQARVALEEDRMKKEPSQNIILTGKGDTLCRDCYSGNPFRSSVEAIQRAINAANEDLLNVGYISLNDVYYLLGIPEGQCGDECGWHIENGLINIQFDSALTPDNEPVLLLRFSNLPRYRYD